VNEILKNGNKQQGNIGFKFSSLIGPAVVVFLAVVSAFLVNRDTVGSLNIRVQALDKAIAERYLEDVQLRSEVRKLDKALGILEREVSANREEFRQKCNDTRTMVHEHELGAHRQCEIRISEIEQRLKYIERAMGIKY